MLSQLKRIRGDLECVHCDKYLVSQTQKKKRTQRKMSHSETPSAILEARKSRVSRSRSESSKEERRTRSRSKMKVTSRKSSLKVLRRPPATEDL
jgi:hypothetical protein